jgi:LPXTG-site transpeptidase (sortase) family protein
MKKHSTKIYVSIAFILIIIGIVLISYNYIKTKTDLVYEEFNVNAVVTEEINTEDIDKEENIEEDDGSYLGILEIPKIDLKRVFYNKNDEQNDVDKNVTILKESSYPDEERGNVILVAHSGSSYLGYFKNLYKLSEGDMARITYKNEVYDYEIKNIYYENKDGTISIKRNPKVKTLTLITCTKDDDTKQTVYILEAI